MSQPHFWTNRTLEFNESNDGCIPMLILKKDIEIEDISFTPQRSKRSRPMSPCMFCEKEANAKSAASPDTDGRQKSHVMFGPKPQSRWILPHEEKSSDQITSNTQEQVVSSTVRVRDEENRETVKRNSDSPVDGKHRILIDDGQIHIQSGSISSDTLTAEHSEFHVMDSSQDSSEYAEKHFSSDTRKQHISAFSSKAF
ncbi:hypothetical protein AB6A40_008884 [Gnathostoma spinigerum]|uniref:Uncharacterized protein n=1 Tax=Gnathostoma spinigerum TaxID=75299 RepID=A0ABD6EQD0_9BILA